MAVLHHHQGGGGANCLLLIHGLSATSAVWLPMLDNVAKYWAGAWMAVDLPGHGQSPRLASYSLDELAGSVSDTIEKAGLAGTDITIVGHSLGGVVGLALAAGTHAITPARVLGLGTKVQWSDVEAEKMNRRAHSPTRHWPDRAEALEAYRRASGLYSVENDSPLLLDGIAEEETDGWRLAADPRTFSCGPPPMLNLIERARCPRHLACGSEDPLVTVEQLRGYDPQSEVFPGLGHNAMVENPNVVWEWIVRKAS